MPKTVETRVGVCYNDFKYCTKGETGMLISLVVPCYNEEESLPIFYKEASKIAQQMGISHGADFEFIFVDDGSKDRTLQIARELHRKDARVRYISFSRNFGKEAGIYAGLKAAKGDYVATMDADLQDDVDAMDRMIDAYEAGNDIVYGVRSSRQKDTFFKRNTAQLFYRMLHFLGAEIVYNHADYRLLSRRAAKGLLSFEEVNLFLRGIVPMVGYQSTTVTYERGERFAGESKYPLGKMVAFALEGVTSLSVKPIRMITMGGLFVCLVSLGMLIKAFVDYANGNVEPGWTSVIISIWVLGGLQLFAIGIIGEYIGKKGHQKVGYIGVYETDQAVGIERRNGVLDGLKEYGITPRKAASILDTFSCVFQGIIPYGAQMLVAISAASELGCNVSAFQIMPKLFYPFLLFVSSMIFIFVIPAKKER